MKSRPLHSLFALSALVLVLAGCGSSKVSGPSSSTTSTTAATVASTGEEQQINALASGAAKESGSITVYSAEPAALNATLEQAFNTAYPNVPHVTVVSFAGGLLNTRYNSERAAGTLVADVVIDNVDSLGQLYKAGWIEKQTPELVPTLGDFPANLQFPFGAIATIQPQGMMYNTSAVGAQGPTSVMDLINPRFKGQVGLLDPRAFLTNMRAMYALYHLYGADFLQKLAAQHPKYYPGAQPGTAAVASGEISVFYAGYNVNYVTLKKKGAPVAFLQPPSGTGAVGIAGLSTDSKDPLTAQLFVNFVLSRTGQGLMNGDGKGASALGQVAPYGNEAPVLALPPGFFTVDKATVNATAPQILAALGLK